MIGGGTNLWDISFYQDRDLWEANVRYDSPDERWYVALFGKNLGDMEYYQFRTPFSEAFGIAQPALDRTWGLTLGVNFY